MHSYTSLSGNVLRWSAKEELAPFFADIEARRARGMANDTDTIGQERGVNAFRFGMAMRGRGYNIFVTGATGIDKLGMVKKLLAQETDNHAFIKQANVADSEVPTIPDDLCYVNNFNTPEEPLLLRFKAGIGRQFKEDMQDFIDAIKRDIPQLFESQEYIVSKNGIIESHERKTREFFKKLEARVREAGFAVVNMQIGQVQRPDIAPLIDGEPVAMLKLEELQEKGRFPQAELEELKTRYAKLKDEIDSIFLEVRDVQRDVKRKIDEVDKLVFLNAARDFARELFDRYGEPKVRRFLESMLENMAENIDILRHLGQAQPNPLGVMTPPSDAHLRMYSVNLLVDNSELTGPPVIVESYPTYRNLFGNIERFTEQTSLQRNYAHSDFTKINAGSFIKANGGYLVINLMDAITEAGVWQTLKRALKTSVMEIQTFDPYYFILSPSIKPEAIDMDVKVVVLATPQLYHMLRHHDADIGRIFKVWADFDSTMPRNTEALQGICFSMLAIEQKSKLLPFDASAIIATVEQGVRFAGRREKISIAFPYLQDIMEESHYMAKIGLADHVSAQHVREALIARRHRAGQTEEKLQEMIDRGSIFIDTDGAVVGQVNGLAVLGIGHHLFGKPTRITATTAMGKAGIINIEREADLSGALHTKGIYILNGYFHSMFSQDKPLAFSASIAFEQSYGGVDGDSASSTEIYALLSSLSGVPIKQGIAVTGSVNQKGEVQAIGGVNEKIEGFYACCSQKGLTGSQGVMIPHANLNDLMLSEKLVEAVEKGDFHVWAIKTVTEGIEILTGHDAGCERNEAGQYPDGGIFAKADAKLKAFALGLKCFAEEKREQRHLEE